MSKLLRFHDNRTNYFITSVTKNRQPYLLNNYFLLSKIFEEFEREYNINILAWVILNDHFHFIIDVRENNLSNIMKRIKLKFSHIYRKKYNLYRQTIWQSRFWDHIIRDEADMNNHIHYNPIKHGLVTKPFDWKYSSIHEYKDNYPDDWGVQSEIKIRGDFGE